MQGGHPGTETGTAGGWADPAGLRAYLSSKENPKEVPGQLRSVDIDKIIITG